VCVLVCVGVCMSVYAHTHTHVCVLVCVGVCMSRVYGVNVAGQGGWFPRSIWDKCLVSVESVDGTNFPSSTDKCVSVCVRS
jgi:hypothetical protein